MKLNHAIVSLILVFVLSANQAFSKGKKPQLMVYGVSMEALASALQSARSGVETYWVMPTEIHFKEWNLMQGTSGMATSLIGGVWMNVLQEISLKKEIRDSVFKLVSHNIDGLMLEKAIEKLLLDQENLTVIRNTDVVRMMGGKKGFEVQLSNRSKFTVFAVIDATKGRSLNQRLVVKEQNLNNLIEKEENCLRELEANNVRTLLAIADDNQCIYGLTMADVLHGRVGNLFFTDLFDENKPASGSFLDRANVGQAVAACASYCAFYKVNADKLDVRKVQAELLTFYSRILPFIDISIEDPNFSALQRMFLVNILPWDKKGEPYLFHADDSVSVDSVKPVLLQLYTRAQLWFMDNSRDFFTVNNVIELLKVIGFRGDELEEEVAKNWVKRFKFKNTFDLDRPISRYEFAVLLDAYASPFNVKVNGVGVFLR